MLTIHDCWAKTEPYQSLPTHARVSGHVAQTVFREYLSEGDRAMLQRWLGCSDEELTDFIGYLVSLHDIGKAEGRFQQKWPPMLELVKSNGLFQFGAPMEHTRHEKTTYRVMEQLWRGQGQERRMARTYAQILGAHHQGKCGKEGNCADQNWNELQSVLEQMMLAEFMNKQDVLPQITRGDEGRTSALLLGITILSDWIASGTAFSDAEQWISDAGSEQWIAKKAHDFLSRSGLAPIHSVWSDAFHGLWPNIPKDGMRPLQTEIERLFTGRNERYRVVLIEAPMGEGKTEAGLYAAIQMMKRWGKDGFYVALPTAATSNQMVNRMRELLEMHSVDSKVRLLHSMAWLTDAEQSTQANSEDERDEISRWLAPVRRGLLGQYAVGTVDQAMLAATTVKYGVLRLLGLSNKVLVIDEIHSYDVYMMEIIQRLLEWCKALEIPVVMLSATLPPELKAKLLRPYTTEELPQSYPAITAITEDGHPVTRHIDRSVKNQRVTVKSEPFLNDVGQIARLAEALVRDGGCLCVMMNTVKDAQAVYQAIKEIYTGDLMLFHAQFPAKRRTELETQCIEKYGKDKSRRPKQSILVATQVVEQSLDVDFDSMITAVAPIDLLIQRMGRIFRHEDTPRPDGMAEPTQWVLVPGADGSFGVNERIYPPCLLRQTVHLLECRDSVKIPEDLAELVADGYDMEKAPESERDAWLEQMLEDGVKAGSSIPYQLSPPDKAFTPCTKADELFQDDEDSGYLAVKTRLGEPTVRIALLERELFEKIKRFSHEIDGKVVAEVTNQTLARAVMEQSVSVAEKRIKNILRKSHNWYIKGGMLLSGVEIFPAEQGRSQCPGGGYIEFDPELGVMIKDGD